MNNKTPKCKHKRRTLTINTKNKGNIIKTSASNTNQYFHALTALRGLAALWVVLFHMDVIIFYRHLGTLLPHEWSGLLTQGYLWVDFFFILSGFIICHIYGTYLSENPSTKKITKYLITRFFRIYPLHLFTLTILVVGVILTSAFAPAVIDGSWQTYFDWYALISNVFLTNAMNQHTYLSWNIVSWSIGAEWWSYIYAIGLFTYIGNNNHLRSATLTVIAMAGLICLVYLHPKANLDITFDYGFLRCLLEFTIGVSTYKLFQNGWGRNTLSKDRYFIFAILILLSILHWRFNNLIAIPLFSMLVLCAVYNTHHIAALLAKPLPQYLGRISYSVYLMHGVWFLVYWFAMPQLKTSWQIETLTVTQTTLFAISFLALTITSAAYSYRFIEVPFRYSFQRKKPINAESPSTIT